MKLKKNPHDHSLPGKMFRHIPDTVHQYMKEVYKSSKCKNMSHGSYDIFRSLSWVRCESWRKTHAKSLNKKHK